MLATLSDLTAASEPDRAGESRSKLTLNAMLFGFTFRRDHRDFGACENHFSELV